MSQLQNATIGINLSTANALRHIASDLQKNEEKVREALKRLQNIYAEEHAFLGIYEKKIRRLMLELAEEEKHMESVSAVIRMNSLRWANEIEQIVLEHTSPAGTMLPVPAEPEGINIDQLMNSVAINNGRKPITPKTKGEGIPLDCSGHSECFKWIPDPNETFLYKQNEYTYASLFEKYKAYGLDGIEYHNQLPDFSPFADSRLGSPYLDEMPTERLGEEGSYRKASEWVVEHNQHFASIDEVNAYMASHDLVWHEIDLHHVIAVPGDINAAFPHTGGIGMQKNMNSTLEHLVDKGFPNVTLTDSTHMGQEL